MDDNIRLSKEKIIHSAFNFHSKGDIKNALRYYEYFISKGFEDSTVFSNYGVILKNLGRLKEAELLQRKAIELKPNSAMAYNNLGDILKDLKRSDEAVKSLRKAIKINPNLAIAHYNLGTILIDLGKLKEAEISTRHAIELEPDCADFYYNMGVIMKDLGNLKEAEKSTKKAININPNYINYYVNLAVILRDLGKSKEALLIIDKAIKLKPVSANYLLNIGCLLKDLGKLEEAENITIEAIKLNPNSADLHLNLGCILKDMGNMERAEIHTRKAIELKHDYAKAHLNLGGILKSIGKLKEAEISTLKAIEFKSDYVEAYSNLGIILKNIGKIDEAEISLKKALKINPNLPSTYINIGNILLEKGKLIDAKNYYSKAIELNTNSSTAKSELIRCKALICDWSNQNTEKNWLKTIGIKGSSVETLNLLYVEDNPLNQLKRSIKLNKEKYTRPHKQIKLMRKDKIHIGYFSCDFCDHPVMQLIAPLLEQHNKSNFKIYLYSFVFNEDQYTQRAKRSGCIYRNIQELNEIEAVNLARNDKLDIAIDLMGYTKNNRFSIFSYRVAPIQINYLGYPGTSGSENTFDYIIADKVVIPDNYEKYYTEKILRMPNCFLCNGDKIEIDKKSINRKDFNLPDKGFIFTCFNASQKITSREFDIWMRLLVKVKGSILWLKQTNKWAMENLCKEAEKRNVNSSRLIFARNLQFSQHLARYSLGDLGLDTFNYNGHKTTSDALKAGLPVLTKLGESFASRVSSSLLNVAGLSELITYSEKEYEETALRIALDDDERFNLKSKLIKESQSTPLFDTEMFTKNFEDKLKDILI